MGRLIEVPRYHYRHWDVPYGTNDAYKLTSHDFSGLLVSEEHFRKPNGSWSGGGPFMVVRRSLIHSQGDRSKAYWNNGVSVTASSAGSAGTPLFVLPDVSEAAIGAAMDAAVGYSAPGYNRTRPGMPEADLLVGLKELLTEGLPKVPGYSHGSLLGLPITEVPRRLKGTINWFKALGGEYLNIVFGWKPFVNDLRKFLQACGNLDRRLRQLAAQNGQVIRRRAVLKDASDSVTDVGQFNSAYANVYGGSGWPSTYGARSVWTRVTTTTEKVWYSGAYRYWIPNPASAAWRLRAIAMLTGAYPTPSALYNAMPWSWLADWFGGLGELLKVFSPSAVDNLVQLYGYTMRHTSTRVECTSTVAYPSRNTKVKIGSTWLGQVWDSADVTCSSIYYDEVKVRTGGFHPFGPDKTADGFSPYQLSVLSALGLTKL